LADSIDEYNAKQTEQLRVMLDFLRTEIDRGLPEAESKCWHGHPVWFLEGNPVAGYTVRKDGVALLFWSGQSFNEPGLTATGSFKMAEVRYRAVDEIGVADVVRWLSRARDTQWDYKNLIKRKGELVPLT
jgi:hypothetical protein